MSWLFDRLYSLAVADGVEVIISVDQIERSETADLDDLTEILLPRRRFLSSRSGSSHPGSAASRSSGGVRRLISTPSARCVPDRPSGGSSTHTSAPAMPYSISGRTRSHSWRKGPRRKHCWGSRRMPPPDIGRLFVTDRTGHTEALRKSREVASALRSARSIPRRL